MQAECPFCQKLAQKTWPAAGEVAWSFRHSVAILGTWQYYHGYCLLISRRHATELSQLDEPERRAYLDEMTTLARAIEQAFRPRKMNYELLGNQVPHLHWHLFPRYDHDPDRLKPVWLALDRAEQDEAERTRLQQGPVDRKRTVEMLQQQLRELTGASS